MRPPPPELFPDGRAAGPSQHHTRKEIRVTIAFERLPSAQAGEQRDPAATTPDERAVSVGAAACGPEECVPTKNCEPDIECSPASHVTTTSSPGFADPCIPQADCEPGDKWCAPRTDRAAGFLWLDITRKCQLECSHCYNSSGPNGTHGTMTRDDWFSVLDQAVRTGIEQIQLIGGEPTMNPHFAEILSHALTIGLQVEVFSNLVHVKPEWWDLFRRPGVSLATSYYSDDASEHNAITGRNSHRKTRANIARAVELGIPMRAGVIEVRPTQNVQAATADLLSLGVLRVGTDRLRHFGRGEQVHASRDVNELCGNCGDGRAAIGPDGTVTPCIMSSWLAVGNVKTAPLAGILAGEDMARATAVIPKRTAAGPCDPGAECKPDAHPCYPENE